MAGAAELVLVTGGTGAGKTTRARQIAGQNGGLCFSIDDWMTTLFWMDSPQPIVFEWTMERIARCEAMIWSVAQQVLANGRCAVLDLGFTTREHRRAFAARAAAAGYPSRLIWIDIPAEERWRRVQLRNQERGQTFAMHVDRAMFDFMESRWEAPDASENVQAIGDAPEAGIQA